MSGGVPCVTPGEAGSRSPRGPTGFRVRESTIAGRRGTTMSVHNAFRPALVLWLQVSGGGPMRGRATLAFAAVLFAACGNDHGPSRVVSSLSLTVHTAEWEP